MPGLNWRIHVTGASGSGTSTLGRALAAHLKLRYVDSDDHFWEKTDPPFTTKNPRRAARLAAALGSGAWVLGGSVANWGDFLRPLFTHVVFLTLSAELRLERLRARELARFGDRLRDGGDLHQQHRDFLAWAAQYDQGGLQGRSRKMHEAWLRELPCPILRLQGDIPTPAQVQAFEVFCAPLAFTVEKATAAGALVDPLYAALGRSARAREQDVFFVARGATGDTLGCVRYCEEERTPMLRSMLVHERARGKGVGKALLGAFERFVDEKKAREVYCVPFAHLASFYAAIGFRAVESGPPFLLERIRQYRADGHNVLLMHRP